MKHAIDAQLPYFISSDGQNSSLGTLTEIRKVIFKLS